MQPETYTAKSLHASGATRETLPDDTGTLLFSARNTHSETNSLGIYAYMSLYVDVCVYIYISKEYRETIGIFDLGIFISHTAPFPPGDS